MQLPKIVTGDDAVISVTIYTGDEVESIPGTATIMAALVDVCHENKLHTNDVEQFSTADGADWTNGVVVIEIPSAETSTVTHQGSALVEIQITEAGKVRTRFAEVDIVTGLVA